jgi:TM2 domain-containing membrane protein YozV
MKKGKFRYPGKEEWGMRVIVISLVVAGLILSASGFCLANGEAPVTKKAQKAGVSEPAKEVEKRGFLGIGRKKEEVIVSEEAIADLKSPGVATILSTLVPGLGQVYNDDGLKALIMGTGEALCWVLIGAADMDGVGIMGLALGRIISPVDAYYSAVEKNESISVKIDNEKVLVAVKKHF